MDFSPILEKQFIGWRRSLLISRQWGAEGTVRQWEVYSFMLRQKKKKPGLLLKMRMTEMQREKELPHSEDF